VAVPLSRELITRQLSTGIAIYVIIIIISLSLARARALRRKRRGTRNTTSNEATTRQRSTEIAMYVLISLPLGLRRSSTTRTTRRQQLDTYANHREGDLYFSAFLSEPNEYVTVIPGALEALSGWLTEERASFLPRD
jgi:hypothetical protein